MNGKTFSFVIVFLIALGVFISSLNGFDKKTSEKFKAFDSMEELNSYIKNSELLIDGNFRGGFGATESSGLVVKSEDSFKAGSSLIGSDYSKTNIQVDGVDELDIIKNDGKYIYAVKENKVLIIDAFPAESMQIISELKFENFVNGVYIENNNLIIIESSYGYGIYLPEESDLLAAKLIAPENSKSETKIHVYDITNELIYAPELLQTFVTEGNYYNSRLIEGHVYVISNKYIDYSDPVAPFFKEGEDMQVASLSKIYYPGYYQSNLVFTSVISIDIDKLEYNWDVFLIGSNNVIYVSEDSIYLVGSKSYDYNLVLEDSLKLNLEILPTEYNKDIKEILDSKEDYYIKFEKIQSITQKYFNSLNIEQKKEFENKYHEIYKKYYSEMSKIYEKTLIHKIKIDGLDIEYFGSGEVSGSVLNQFSMDEFRDYFRIATTTGNSFGNIDGSLNHLYVLDEDLEIVGKVEDLAEGERIYSARFLGDKAYLVTFRQVDPLYVIDLSNSKKPEVLGYLKITGFSNYLHPIGDGLLLGIGHEADEDGRAEGLKISLFDVSDFNDIRELDKYVIEKDYSYSDAEYEHKAVLYDSKLRLLVIPVSYSENLGNKWDYWQGAYVFNLLENDIVLKGNISHDSENNDSFDIGYVQRSLYIEEFLYTFSNKMIKANDVENLTEISKVIFTS